MRKLLILVSITALLMCWSGLVFAKANVTTIDGKWNMTTVTIQKADSRGNVDAGITNYTLTINQKKNGDFTGKMNLIVGKTSKEHKSRTEWSIRGHISQDGKVEFTTDNASYWGSISKDNKSIQGRCVSTNSSSSGKEHDWSAHR